MNAMGPSAPGTPLRHRATVAIAVLLILLTVVGVPVVRGDETPAAADGEAIGRTPPRLSFIDGQVSFWRPGADEWVGGRINTPLAPGDELYTGHPGNLELQIGGRAWIRAWASTQLGLAGLEPDFLQVRVTAGHVTLDIRRIDPGHTVELNTPNAVFTIERAGYYRVNVTEDRTSFISRRGGRATVTPASGAEAAIASSEEVIVEGEDSPSVATYVAPELDAWDRWNYARTEALIDSVSTRYVSPEIYGVGDLDHHGTWRVVDTYGAVWVPASVPAGWAPYTSGTWLWDPYYGWTWVDTAPWGWAPYHYGRWVFVHGYWAWSPGPLVVRPVYAPALVAFLGPRVSVSVSVGGPAVGWVALGWGEPLIPWWGRPGFVGVPWWAGWGGPRIVNNVVVERTTVVHVHQINVYRNATVRNAVTVVPRERFGRGPVTRTNIIRVDAKDLEPVRGKLEVAPSRASLAPDTARGVRPPESILNRRVMTTRAPDNPRRWLEPQGIEPPSRPTAAAPRLVPPSTRRSTSPTDVAPRPPFGASKIERLQPAPTARPERVQPPQPSRERAQPVTPRPERPQAAPPGATAKPSPAPPAGTARPEPAPRGEAAKPSPAPPGGAARPQPAPPAGTAQPQPAPPATGGRPATPGIERAPSATAPPRALTPESRPQTPTIRQAPNAQGRRLPGEPANRLFPGRAQDAPARTPAVERARPEQPTRSPRPGITR